MNILHLSKFFRPDPGGLERVVAQLVDGAARADHQVRVVCATGSSWVRDPNKRITEPPRGGVAIVRLPTPRVVWGQPMASGYYAASLWPADVVHHHQPHPLADLAIVRGPRRPLVITHHSDVRRQWLARPFYWPLVRAALRRASAIVVPTEAHLPACPELHGFESKVRVIPFGVDIGRFTPRVHPRRPVGFPTDDGRPTALFVGRLVGYKGLDVLVEAVTGTALRVVLVGGGPERARIEAMVEARGLQDQVIFAGEIPDAALADWYQAADYVVLPSVTTAEMFGVVLLEAMAMTRPIITTAVPTGVRDVNRPGTVGLEVPVGDAGALREAMKALADDRELRVRMGEAGRRRAQEHFSLDQCIAGHLALYEEIR